MLSQIVALSQNMLATARQGEWERVSEMQIERQQLIEKKFPLDVGVADTDGAADQIRLVLDMDRQLMQLAKEQQKAIGETLGKLNQGRAATRAYRDTSRG